MANPLAVMPDAKLMVLQYLRLRPEITALTSASKIVTQIPVSPDYSTPYVIVQWGGGNGIWPALDEPSMQIDVLGGTEVSCGTLMRTVRAAMWAIANDVVSAGTLVSMTSEVAPAWLPDTVATPPTPRFMAQYHILSHP